MKILSILLAVMVFTTPNTSLAQTVPEPRNMFIKGGVLCDTEEDLQKVLTGISLNGGKFPDQLYSCGRFVPESPLPAVVTPLYWYETPAANTLVARFFFPMGNWTQYGWIAFMPNPNYQAEPTGEQS